MLRSPISSLPLIPALMTHFIVELKLNSKRTIARAKLKKRSDIFDISKKKTPKEENSSYLRLSFKLKIIILDRVVCSAMWWQKCSSAKREEKSLECFYWTICKVYFLRLNNFPLEFMWKKWNKVETVKNVLSAKRNHPTIDRKDKVTRSEMFAANSCNVNIFDGSIRPVVLRRTGAATSCDFQELHCRGGDWRWARNNWFSRCFTLPHQLPHREPLIPQ